SRSAPISTGCRAQSCMQDLEVSTSNHGIRLLVPVLVCKSWKAPTWDARRCRSEGGRGLNEERRSKILETVAKLRVTDIRDGMDWMGLHHIGSVHPEIRPLWRTKAAGFARTYRHIPTKQRVPELKPDDYTKWAYEYWYGQLWNMGDFREQVGEGDFLVIDTMGQKTPAVGSMDSMVWAAKGVKGVLTNGGARDTDE